MVPDTSRAAPADATGRDAAPADRTGAGRATVERVLTWQFLGAIALLLLIGTLVSAGMVMASAEGENRAALASERHLVVSALNSALGDLGRLALGYTLWDDAAEHLLVQFDADWANANVGRRLIRAFGLTASITLDSADRRIFVAVRDGIDTDATLEALAGDLAKLVTAARRLPADAAYPVTGIAMGGSLPYLVGAAAFAPDGPAVQPAGRGVLVMIRALDPVLLTEMGEIYDLGDLRLAGAEAAAESAAVPLIGPDGRVAAALVWETAVPGTTLLQRLLPVLGGATALLALLAFGMIKIWQRAIGRITLHQRHLAAILDGAADAIVTIDDNGRVVGFNAAAERIFGHPAAAMIGHDIAAILPDAGQDRALLAPGGREARGRRADGSDFAMEITISVVEEQEARLSCGIFRDITRRKADEAALYRAGREAQIASQAKSAFLATMSHELRTPLNAIIGFSEVMQNVPLERTQIREYAGDIRDSGVHLLRLINDILEVSQIEIGRETLREGLVRVGDSVAAMLQLVRASAEAAGVALVHAVPEDVPPLRADERKLKQMLLGLLSNAIKFTPAGGAVTVLAEHRPAGDLAVTVADTGIGIPPERIEEVLRPFSQLDPGLARQRGGAGLGLALTKGLVELHGGRLLLESTPQQGTRATLLFPAARVDPTPLTRLV